MNCEEFRRLARAGDQVPDPESGARRTGDAGAGGVSRGFGKGRAGLEDRAAGGGGARVDAGAAGSDRAAEGDRAGGEGRALGGAGALGDHPVDADLRASGDDGIDAALAAHLDACVSCGRWLEERISEPPAGLLPARLEVPSPTLRERSLPFVPAISPCRAEIQREPPASPIARQPADEVPGSPRPGWQEETSASSHGGMPAVPWWEGWFRPWGQALALAGAAALVLVALRTGPRLPDQASGGHQPAPAVSLLAQVQFLDPADEPAGGPDKDYADDLGAEPVDGEVADSGEDPAGTIGPEPFPSAFDGTFEIAVTDATADVSHEWSFLEMQESDYTFLDDSEKEESWSEESRG